MGSGIFLRDDSVLKISAENVKKIEESKEVIKAFEYTDLAGEDPDFVEMCKWIGFYPNFDREDGETVLSITPEGEEASNMFDEFMLAIAPYVEEGGYIEYEQYGELHRAVFDGKTCETRTASLDWEDEESEDEDEEKRKETKATNKAQAEMILSTIHENFIDVGEEFFYDKCIAPEEQIGGIVENANRLGITLSDMMKKATNEHGDMVYQLKEEYKNKPELHSLAYLVNGYMYFMHDTLIDFYSEKMEKAHLTQKEIDDKIDELTEGLGAYCLSHDRSWYLSYRAKEDEFPTTLRDIGKDLRYVFDWEDFAVKNEELAKKDKYIVFGEMFDYGQLDAFEIGEIIFDEYKEFIHEKLGNQDADKDIVQKVREKNEAKRAMAKETKAPSPSV